MPRKVKRNRDEEQIAPAAKKAKLLDEDEESEDNFQINEDFAKRFEHNNKRKELQQLEEKYGNGNVNYTNGVADEDSESSTDESEDDDGEFATAELDNEINDVLQAIRNKDPRTLDPNAKFFKEFTAPDENRDGDAKMEPKEKSMNLKEYHRQNFIAAANGVPLEEEPVDRTMTYLEEQSRHKEDLVKALHDAAGAAGAASEDEEDGAFLKAKTKPVRQPKVRTSLPDPSTADKDPETYLSNFFAARAWVPSDNSKFAHLDSSDEEDVDRAEQFEAAYNLRFEDPATSNIKLKTFARDAVAAQTVRRDEAMNPRKRAREREREERQRHKDEREAEKARLRKLKVEQMEGKLERIRYAAGGADVDVAEWADVLQEDWDDAKFDEEMQKRFGDQYYEGKDDGIANEDSGDEEVAKSKTKKKLPEKPTWDDDIDIKDLVADFEDEPEAPVLSDEDEPGNENQAESDGDEILPDAPTTSKRKSKTASKRDRRLIESLAQQSIDAEVLPKGKKAPGPRFAYRETSPTTFGLTPLDILAADDAQLNEWAGLKKLATFRDAEKKEKDRRRLGKKGRLREWRKEVFGRKEGARVEDWVVDGAQVRSEATGVNEVDVGGGGVDIVEGGKKKKKRSRGKKGKSGEVEA